MKKRLLRKSVPSKEQAVMSRQKAEAVLEDAKANLGEERYDACTLIAYTAILSAARGILFNDGYREKSHACTVRYLEKTYGNRFGSRMMGLFDTFREKRHDVQYSPVFRATKEDAVSIVEFAEDFIQKADEIISQ